MEFAPLPDGLPHCIEKQDNGERLEEK
jgi:hypothetical protein